MMKVALLPAFKFNLTSRGLKILPNKLPNENWWSWQISVVTWISAVHRSNLPEGVIVYDTNTSNHVLKLCALRITWWNWLSLNLKFLTYEVGLCFISCLCRAEVERIYFWAWSSIFSCKLINWSCEIHRWTLKYIYKRVCGRKNF